MDPSRSRSFKSASGSSRPEAAHRSGGNPTRSRVAARAASRPDQGSTHAWRVPPCPVTRLLDPPTLRRTRTRCRRATRSLLTSTAPSSFAALAAIRCTTETSTPRWCSRRPRRQHWAGSHHRRRRRFIVSSRKILENDAEWITDHGHPI